jgi:hypothetical protein
MADPTLPKDFFTPQSMLTLAGATGSTFVIVNGLQRVFNVNPRWLGLAIAQAIVLVGVYASGGKGIVDYVVGVVNGFLVFCSAGGATDLARTARQDKGATGGAPRGGGRRHFLSSWF